MITRMYADYEIQFICSKATRVCLLPQSSCHYEFYSITQIDISTLANYIIALPCFTNDINSDTVSLCVNIC